MLLSRSAIWWFSISLLLWNTRLHGVVPQQPPQLGVQVAVAAFFWSRRRTAALQLGGHGARIAVSYESMHFVLDVPLTSKQVRSTSPFLLSVILAFQSPTIFLRDVELENHFSKWLKWVSILPVCSHTFCFQVPFHLLFLPSWQNHKVDML